MPGPVLVPILGDQLTRDLASLRGRTKDDSVILMMEVWDEATYVRHHKQKIALIFSAMRHFAEELRDAGWSLAVATGKSDRGLIATLAANDLSDLFESLQTADRHPSKPHPAMLEAALVECGAQASDAVMIGDTSFDIDMAKCAGVAPIGVAWGYHEPAELLRAGAVSVADAPSQLTELILAR